MNTTDNVGKNANVQNFLDELRELAVVVGEDCPEGHRKDPASGRCLPMGSTDHTAFTRSVNNDDGPEWRGEVDKNSPSASAQEVAIDADDMDEPQSCAEGTTFSFIQRQCISLEDAEVENEEGFSRDEQGNPVEEEDAAAPGSGGHKEITLMQPEGRRDPVNHNCPSNQFFDYKRRECIPLNKDTVMASEDFSEDFKKAVATYARIAMTSPDPMDGHRHVATLDMNGDGVTSISGYKHPHSHEVKNFNVIPRTSKEEGQEYTSQHPGVAVPEEHRVEKLDDFGADETSAPITTTQRQGLSDSSFGVPDKRKFPLDTCARVRNAMARFNQAKGITPSEKATLRRKILARAKACDIELRNFAKATTDAEFAAVTQELITMDTKKTEERVESYRAESGNQGPCPPGMNWDSASTRCTKIRGFVKEIAQHSEIVKKQPEGRRDPVGFQCPSGEFFDFGSRKCTPLDPSRKQGTTTSKASDQEEADRTLAPQPSGRPVRLPIDCPPNTLWNKDRNECIPLDSSKKTKSSDEDAGIPPQFLKNIKKKGKDGDKKDDKKGGKKGGFPDFLKKKSKSEEEEADEQGQTTPNGPGNKGGPGCPEGQFMNPITKKCMPRKGAFKGKSEQEEADANPSNREGLTPAPGGKVQHQSDCPANTAWDAKSKVCRPIGSMDKDRPSGASPQSPKSVADEIKDMSPAQLVSILDEIIKEQSEERPKLKIVAKDLPNAAFPPSLVSDERRSLMHHTTDVADPYDTASVDVVRLRSAIFRSPTVKEFSEKAVLDAIDHLLFHAREIVGDHLEKKS